MESIGENVVFISSNYEIEKLASTQVKQLQHLDLSNCQLFNNRIALIQLDNLKTLILHNSPEIDRSLDNIVKIKSLRLQNVISYDHNKIKYISFQIFGYFIII